MRIKSYAKINLALTVLNKSLDNYHNLETIYLETGLYDEIVIKKLTDSKISLKCDDPTLPLGPENTIQKAIQTLKKKYPAAKFPQTAQGLDIQIIKKIPVAAGLGGGSSNAAAILNALNILWKLKIPAVKLQKIAAEIGMDVPFFLRGGIALGSRRGEKIRQLKMVKKGSVLIIFPLRVVKTSTSRAYVKLDKIRKKLSLSSSSKNKTLQLRRLLLQKKQSLHQRKILDFLNNDFDILYQSELKKVGDLLFLFNISQIHCSGAGPSMYAILKEKINSVKLSKEIQKKLGPDYKTWIVGYGS